MSELIEAYRFGCRKGTIILSRLLQVIVVTVETGHCLHWYIGQVRARGRKRDMAG